MQSSASRNIYNRGKGRTGVEGGVMCPRGAINCRQHKEQHNERTAGSWNDLGGWCCSFEKFLATAAPCSRDKWLATKQIYMPGPFGHHRCGLMPPFFALISDEFSWDAKALLAVSFSLPYHHYITYLAIAFARKCIFCFAMRIL